MLNSRASTQNVEEQAASSASVQLSTEIRKSKVMGLGQWRGKQDWPLSWLQTVEDMKIKASKCAPVL